MKKRFFNIVLLFILVLITNGCYVRTKSISCPCTIIAITDNLDSTYTIVFSPVGYVNRFNLRTEEFHQIGDTIK